MKKVVVLIGGNSTEHEVSIVSGINIFNKIQGYEKDIIYLDKDNIAWEISLKNIEENKEDINIEYVPVKENKIENLEQKLLKYDVVFPALHGNFGEDGKLQGYLEKSNIKYVGCQLLSSAICMDKVVAKFMFEKADINVAKYIYLKKYKDKVQYFTEKGSFKEIDIDTLDEEITEKLKYPVFVKPANSGSSVGITKVYKKNELSDALDIAFNEDVKVLIEENLNGKEIECAVLECEDEIFASKIGEILPAEDFYSYSAKYINPDSKTVLLKETEEKLSEIKALAVKAFKLMDCKGLSRVDMFLVKDKIYLNEINTLPGFTSISMYPQLLKESGYDEKEFLNILIQNALNS